MVQLLLQFRAGTIFVTTLEAGIINGAKVAEYDATSGAVVNDSLITGLNGPEGITISGMSLFVPTSTSVPAIAEYTISGVPIATPLIAGSPLGGVLGIAATSNGEIFVVNHGLGSVAAFTTSGDTINGTLITGTGPESFNPYGIAVVVPEPCSFFWPAWRRRPYSWQGSVRAVGRLASFGKRMCFDVF